MGGARVEKGKVAMGVERLLEGENKPHWYASRPGTSGGMPGTIQKEKRKGGYGSRPGTKEGMPWSIQRAGVGGEK